VFRPCGGHVGTLVRREDLLEASGSRLACSAPQGIGCSSGSRAAAQWQSCRARVPLLHGGLSVVALSACWRSAVRARRLLTSCPSSQRGAVRCVTVRGRVALPKRQARGSLQLPSGLTFGKLVVSMALASFSCPRRFVATSPPHPRSEVIQFRG